MVVSAAPEGGPASTACHRLQVKHAARASDLLLDDAHQAGYRLALRGNDRTALAVPLRWRLLRLLARRLLQLLELFDHGIQHIAGGIDVEHGGVKPGLSGARDQLVVKSRCKRNRSSCLNRSHRRGMHCPRKSRVCHEL